MKPLDEAVRFDFANHKSGNTFIEREFTITTSHGDLIKVEIEFYSHHVMSSDGIGPLITITDAAAGKWKINQQVIDWNPGIYEYYATFTFDDDTTDGFVKTYMYGTIEIV